MSGIYVAAAITSVVAFVLYGLLLRRLAAPDDRRAVLAAVLLTLPLQPLAFYLVRLPLDGYLANALGQGSVTYQWLATLYAPLTEEPAKLLPLLIPALRRRLRPENAVPFALALGLGFGIGEVWFIANHVAANAKLAALPFYAFGGFFIERFMVCFMHGAITAVALRGIRGRFLWGFLGALALHYALNFPIFMSGHNVGGLGQELWMLILFVWVFAFFVGMGALVAWLHFGKVQPGRLLLGEMTCPNCQANYPRPLFGFNFVWWRYERCPHCRRYHWCRM